MNQAMESAKHGTLMHAAIAATALVLAGVSPAAFAAYGDRSGKVVVETVCATCHATGANGAPRIGDRAAWSARAARGLTGLTQSALNGIRKMPAHGGNHRWLYVDDLDVAHASMMLPRSTGPKTR